MAFWVHVEKGYTIFIVYFSSFKSLESLESLARLLKKVLKSCETFKIQDFANASSMHVPRRMYNMGCRNSSIGPYLLTSYDVRRNRTSDAYLANL